MRDREARSTKLRITNLHYEVSEKELEVRIAIVRATYSRMLISDGKTDALRADRSSGTTCWT